MPTTRSAEKRLRQQQRRYERNRAQRSRLKTAIKQVLAAEDADAATEAYRRTAAMLDRFANRRIIHPNRAVRKKSQLARHVQAVGGTP